MGKKSVDRDLIQSRILKEKAGRVIPGASQTFSKGPNQFVQNVAPAFLARGKGSHVWDVDGNEYIDYPMALGAIILGHNYPAISDTLIQQLQAGVSFSLPHPLEIEVAELLIELIPCAEMVRFAKNGSDATTGAIRAARAYTQKDVIACCGYHGWHDWYIGTTTRDGGIPQPVQSLTMPFNYNDVGSLEKIFNDHQHQVAAVIMEPVGIVEPEADFLARVRDLTRNEGALLIYDEIITGFRVAMGGAQEYYGVTPDLACFGKAMGNGLPISAVVGTRDIMEVFDEVFFSFTFGGEALSLTAAKSTIKELMDRNVIDHLWRQGEKIKDGFNRLASQFGIEQYTQCRGLPPRTVSFFMDGNGKESLIYKSLFQQECLKREILFSGGHNICFSHSDDDIAYTIKTYEAAMKILADAIAGGDALQKLEGEPVQPVFRKP